MTIGWYTHHHGLGHRHRLAAVAPLVSERVVGLGSGPPPEGVDEWVALPGDERDEPREPTAGGTLHWAPLHHTGLSERMAAISAWLLEARPSLMVVDVSVEVALLVRLHGVPTVVVAQRGRRTDEPHRLAYRQAAAIVAPWTRATHEAGSLPREADVRFVGAISRFDGETAAPARPRPVTDGDVLVLLGAGGRAITQRDVARAARTTPSRLWHVAGPVEVNAPNVRSHGSGADVEALLQRCSVVVGTAGSNVVGEVAAARRAFVCLPQERPFAEQHAQGEALATLGVAKVCRRWPVAEQWPAALAEAEALDLNRWSLLHDGAGARRMAAAIEEVAACA